MSNARVISSPSTGFACSNGTRTPKSAQSLVVCKKDRALAGGMILPSSVDMALQSMPFLLEYTINPPDYAAQQAAIDPNGRRRFRNDVFTTRASWFVVSCAGLVAAMRAQLDLLGIAFLCIAAVQIVLALFYRRQYENVLAFATAGMPQKRVRLLVDESGLHETVEGIESFAPWEVVKSFVVVDQTLLLNLTAGLWSIIPQSAFSSEGSSTLEEFLALLASKGIPKLESHGAPAHAGCISAADGGASIH